MAIKNIIFDLGGVVLNLDQQKTIRAFKKLGADLDQLNENSSLFTDFETGKIDANFFVDTLHAHLNGTASKEAIIHAWNSMLLELPSERVDLINSLKKDYQLILLSNTNSIHIDAVYQEHGKEVFESLFSKIFLSHEIGLRKPTVECYKHVLAAAGIKGEESIFVDDMPINIKGAEQAGIHTIWAKLPVDNWFIEDLKKIQLVVDIH